MRLELELEITNHTDRGKTVKHGDVNCWLGPKPADYAYLIEISSDFSKSDGIINIGDQGREAKVILPKSLYTDTNDVNNTGLVVAHITDVAIELYLYEWGLAWYDEANLIPLPIVPWRYHWTSVESKLQVQVNTSESNVWAPA